MMKFELRYDWFVRIPHIELLGYPESETSINQHTVLPQPSLAAQIHSQMIEDCHRRFREDELIDQLIVLLEQHVSVWTGFMR